MKQPNFNIVPEIKGKLRFDKQMFLYLAFVLLAALMWFFNKLGDETNDRLLYPVTFINMPVQKIVVNGLPDNFELTVQGRGWDILRYKMGKSPEPIVINLSRLNHILSKESTIDFSLATTSLSEEIKSQLPANIVLNVIQPDTIHFVLSNYSEKHVPVVPILDLTFDHQCLVDGDIVVTPNEITVNGPDIILDTLQAVYTKPISARKVRRSLRKNVELAPIEGVALRLRKVDVNVPVAKYTEESISIPIDVVNEPDSLRVRLMPGVVDLKFWVSMKDYSHINRDDFKAEVDVRAAMEQTGLQVPVALSMQPACVRNVVIDPEIVNFVLETK